MKWLSQFILFYASSPSGFVTFTSREATEFDCHATRDDLRSAGVTTILIGKMETARRAEAEAGI